MPETLLKNFFMTLCCIYIYIKILNVQYSQRIIFLSLPFAVLTSIASNYVRMHIPFLTLCTIAVFIFFFCWKVFRKPPNINISAVTVSLSISYLFFTVSLSLLLPIGGVMLTLYKESIYLNIGTLFTTGIVQLILTFLFFRIKRFKKGIPNFEKKFTNDICVFLSALLLIIASLLNLKLKIDIFTILYIFVLLFGLILYLWWRRNITHTYLESVQLKNTEHLETIIEEQKNEIDYLKSEIEQLSKIIHKDNKLIPALELTVKELCLNDQTENGQLLLLESENLTNERKGIIQKYEETSKPLAKTGVLSLDIMVNYLFQRASAAHIAFDLSLTGDIQYMTANIISKDDMSTLLADLGENAIIAASASVFGRLLIALGIRDNYYCADFYDNGINFDANTILHFGKQRYTTHAHTGGSGIGLMTTSELLKKYNASIEIEEFMGNPSYTKRISVIFDGSSEIRIKSSRDSIIAACSKRPDIKLQIN